MGVEAPGVNLLGRRDRPALRSDQRPALARAGSDDVAADLSVGAQIRPRQLVDTEGTEHGDEVVVLGHTTGSHLNLPDEDESQLTVIWRATVKDGLLALWQILENTPARREELGLTVE